MAPRPGEIFVILLLIHIDVDEVDIEVTDKITLLTMTFMTEKWSGVIPGVMGLRGVFLFLLPCLLPLR